MSIPGPKILLMGPGGTGKTHSLGTLCDWAQAHGKTMFVLGLDQGLEALFGYYTDRDLPIPPCLQWKWQITKPLGLKQLSLAADQVAKFSYEAITKMLDPNRSDNNAFLKILETCSKPVSDRDGKEFPSLDQWDSSMIFAVDGLSELSNAAMKMVIGSKPTASMPDYGVAQNNLMNFLRLCAQGSRYTFVMISHVVKQKNELTGAETIQISTIGNAISSQIPPMFSDVIYTVREGDKFFWDTAAYGVETKTRSLGYRSKIPPDFSQIMDVWLKRGGE